MSNKDKAKYTVFTVLGFINLAWIFSQDKPMGYEEIGASFLYWICLLYGLKKLRSE